MINGLKVFIVIVITFLSIGDSFSKKMINGPRHESYISENGEYIYTMWVYPKESDEMQPRTIRGANSGITIKYSEFPFNGLYELKSKNFLWKARAIKNGREKDINGIPLDDGETVFEYHRDWNQKYPVLNIYRNGIMKQSYFPNDFCNFNGDDFTYRGKVSSLRSHFEIDNKNKILIVFVCNKKFEIDVEKQTLNQTSDDSKFVNSSWHFDKEVIISFIASVLLCLLFIIFVIFIRKSKKWYIKTILSVPMIITSLLLIFCVSILFGKI